MRAEMEEGPEGDMFHLGRGGRGNPKWNLKEASCAKVVGKGHIVGHSGRERRQVVQIH